MGKHEKAREKGYKGKHEKNYDGKHAKRGIGESIGNAKRAVTKPNPVRGGKAESGPRDWI